MAEQIPAELIRIAEDAAKDELADCPDCRQQGKHVGRIVLQVVWAWLAESEAVGRG